MKDFFRVCDNYKQIEMLSKIIPMSSAMFELIIIYLVRCGQYQKIFH